MEKRSLLYEMPQAILHKPILAAVAMDLQTSYLLPSFCSRLYISHSNQPRTRKNNKRAGEMDL